MSNETYIGHRYVPQVEGEWSNNKEYEELSIVLYEGNSYTSKQKVPVGVDINNTNFWALSGNYNAQMDQLKKEFDTAVGAVTVDSEVVLARGENTTLGSRLNEIESEKANVTQDDWIKPTLLNGWVNDSNYPVSYMKDSLGFVHLKGSMKGSVDLSSFVLPVGYRQSGVRRFPCVIDGNASFVQISHGDVKPQKTTSFYCNLDGISFKAE